jgi:cell wall-associated NlpC family hydrolase
LGLRYNHPAADDRLELYPSDHITVAEGAYSYARVLSFPRWRVSTTRQSLAGFALPAYTAPQLKVLRLAVSKIGMPYIWAGESDTAEPATWTWGAQFHGGYDCSGFIWRVFKLSANPAGTKIRGRTAAQMAGEFASSQRIAAGALKPADVLFFGSAGFAGKATESSIIHAGLYLGDNWVIHSSSEGVYVLPLKGSWLGDSFAWGRRVL